MHMLYQQFKVIEGMELSKAIWYRTGNFSAYYEFIILVGIYGYTFMDTDSKEWKNRRN